MYADEDAKGNDLVLSVSRDGGQTFAEPVKVNDDTKPASHGMHSLAVDQNGRVFMAWLDERNLTKSPPKVTESMSLMHHEDAEPNSEVYYAASSDGGKTFSENKKLATEVCPCCKTSMLAASDGSLYLSWRQVLPGDFRHIAVSHSTDGGKTFSEGVIVSNDQWRIHACPVSGATLAADKDNKISVAWYSGNEAGQAGVYFTRSADGGRSFDPRQLVSDDATGGTPVLQRTEDGRLLVVFAGTDDVVTAVVPTTTDEVSEIASIADTRLPAAALGNGSLYTAVVRDESGHDSVWLYSLTK